MYNIHILIFTWVCRSGVAWSCERSLTPIVFMRINRRFRKPQAYQISNKKQPVSQHPKQLPRPPCRRRFAGQPDRNSDWRTRRRCRRAAGCPTSSRLVPEGRRRSRWAAGIPARSGGRSGTSGRRCWWPACTGAGSPRSPGVAEGQGVGEARECVCTYCMCVRLCV